MQINEDNNLKDLSIHKEETLLCAYEKKTNTNFPYAVVFNPAAVNYKAADVPKSD